MKGLKLGRRHLLKDESDKAVLKTEVIESIIAASQTHSKDSI